MSLGTPQTKNETPSFAGILQALMHTELLKLYTGMPGVIQDYNKNLGTASIQPGIKRKYVLDDEVVNLPIINNVPIIFQRAGEAVITLPLKKGDTVWLMFSQRSLERWKTEGGVVEAGDPRHHALADAVAIPGIYPSSVPIVGVDGDNLVVRHGSASKITVKKDEVEVSVGSGKLTVDKTGKVYLGNGTTDIVDLLDQLIDAITTATYPTGVGPSGTAINAPIFELIKQKLGLIKS